jgi:hypothetical protein
MKNISGLILAFALFIGVATAATKSNRTKIGSTFTAPISYNGKYYFVAKSGVLFESEKDFSKLTQLYVGKKLSIGSATLSGDLFIWGDGLHNDQKSTLHIFDLKNRKLLKDIEVSGHIERAPLVHGGTIYFGQGPAGVHAIDAQNFTTKWELQVHENKKLHVVSNIIPFEDKICATSIFDLKGVFCINTKTGKIVQFAQLMRDPKSEITAWKNHVVGFATEGDLSKAKWDIPSDLFIYDIKTDKIKMSKELRGFNIFAPEISGDEAFVTLSTGDFILVNLIDGKITFLGEFPEPFTNNPFKKGNDYCAVGMMGKYLCYGRIQTGFIITIDKRLPESVLGRVSLLDSKLVAPTRQGFLVE